MEQKLKILKEQSERTRSLLGPQRAQRGHPPEAKVDNAPPDEAWLARYVLIETSTVSLHPAPTPPGPGSPQSDSQIPLSSKNRHPLVCIAHSSPLAVVPRTLHLETKRTSCGQHSSRRDALCTRGHNPAHPSRRSPPSRDSASGRLLPSSATAPSPAPISLPSKAYRISRRSQRTQRERHLVRPSAHHLDWPQSTTTPRVTPWG